MQVPTKINASSTTPYQPQYKFKPPRDKGWTPWPSTHLTWPECFIPLEFVSLLKSIKIPSCPNMGFLEDHKSCPISDGFKTMSPKKIKSAERSNVPLDLATLARHLGDSWPRTTVSCTNPRKKAKRS